MNRRISKKKHKCYCNTRHIGYWQCSKCGWDSLSDPSHSQIKYISYDKEDWLVHCQCPVCGNKFDYCDGL